MITENRTVYMQMLETTKDRLTRNASTPCGHTLIHTQPSQLHKVTKPIFLTPGMTFFPEKLKDSFNYLLLSLQQKIGTSESNKSDIYNF